MDKGEFSEPRQRPKRKSGTGRDELNLAEFPITTLADRPSRGQSTLVFEDRMRDKGRNVWVTRRLTVAACEKYGLPTALDDEVIVGLMQLTKASGFESHRIYFSRYELIRTLGWRDEGKSYSRLEKSLRRWLGVTLYYENAWWDRRREAWVNAHFHLLEHVLLYGRSRKNSRSLKGKKELPLSSFTWNEVVFASFKAGYLKQLDMEFYRSLRLPTAKRMYRFLDKRFYRSSRLTFDLFQFACEHIGLSRCYDAAQLKRRLASAITELEDVGFLLPVKPNGRYTRVRKGKWEVEFSQNGSSVARRPTKEGAQRHRQARGRKAISQEQSRKKMGLETRSGRTADWTGQQEGRLERRRAVVDAYLQSLPEAKRDSVELDAFQAASSFALEVMSPGETITEPSPMADAMRQQIIDEHVLNLLSSDKNAQKA